MNAATKEAKISVEEARLRTAIALLSGERVLKGPVRTELEMHQLLETGLPAKAAINLARQFPELTRREIIPKTLGMSRRIFQRYQESPTARLSVHQSGRVWLFARIMAIAIDVFGSREEAVQWLRELAYGLEQKRPIDLLSTPVGVCVVRTYLTRIDAGVYT